MVTRRIEIGQQQQQLKPKERKNAPILKLGIKYLGKGISTVWQNVVLFHSRDKINNIMYDMSTSVHGQTKRLAKIATKHQCK